MATREAKKSKSPTKAPEARKEKRKQPKASPAKATLTKADRVRKAPVVERPEVAVEDDNEEEEEEEEEGAAPVATTSTRALLDGGDAVASASQDDDEDGDGPAPKKSSSSSPHKPRELAKLMDDVASGAAVVSAGKLAPRKRTRSDRKAKACIARMKATRTPIVPEAAARRIIKDVFIEETRKAAVAAGKPVPEDDATDWRIEAKAVDLVRRIAEEREVDRLMAAQLVASQCSRQTVNGSDIAIAVSIMS